MYSKTRGARGSDIACLKQIYSTRIGQFKQSNRTKMQGYCAKLGISRQSPIAGAIAGLDADARTCEFLKADGGRRCDSGTTSNPG